MTLLLIVLLIALAIAGLTGRGTDSRDPSYGLWAGQHRPTTPSPGSPPRR
ncbi:MAG: hypothetical protein ACR2N4_02200 [Jatrophihabitans sp.]